MSNIVRWLTRPFRGLLGGGTAWGYLRIGLILGLVLLWATLNQGLWAESGAESYPLWWFIGWRYFIPAGFALLGGLLAAGNYVARLHQLTSWRAGVRYVWANATSLWLPRLLVQDGKAEFEIGKTNLIQQVGGPGYLYVRPGTAVVLESLDAPTRVLGTGRYFLSRLEHLRELISLADQQGTTEKLACMSKDGLEVNVQRLQYRYRLMAEADAADGRRTLQDPYPFSAAAALDLAYQRNVNAAGLMAWDQAVKIAVEGVLTDYVNVNWFDKVMAPLPVQADPRARMSADMAGIQGRLQGFGTDFLWTDIGNFVPASAEVERQRVETWGVKWVGAADLEAAKADAERLAAQELGRAEAQADLLNHLLSALGQLGSLPDSRQNLQTLIVLRTAQLLETMVESGKSTAHHTPTEQPLSLSAVRMLLDN